MKPFPLAAAQARLGRPGRPRKAGDKVVTATTPARVNGGPQSGPLATQASAPRLLGLADTASYLGVSGWTVRDLEANGTLRRVKVPLPNGGELRKLLFDRLDLDRLIEGWKT